MRFHLIDRIEEVHYNSSITAIKCVSLSDDVFDEHFPGHPVYPGSLVIESLAHTAGIVVVVVSVFLTYRYADRILSRLGPTGTVVLVRLSAFILLCIGVQIVWSGLFTLLGSVPTYRAH